MAVSQSREERKGVSKSDYTVYSKCRWLILPVGSGVGAYVGKSMNLMGYLNGLVYRLVYS